MLIMYRYLHHNRFLALRLNGFEEILGDREFLFEPQHMTIPYEQ